MDSNKLIEILGTEDLVKLFEEMDIFNQNKILFSSFKEGAKIIISEARNNLKGSYTHVSNSLGVKQDKSTQSLKVGALYTNGGQLAHIANAGTKERYYKTKNGQVHKTGRIIGSRFWDNALTSTETQVEQAIFKSVKEKFDELLQKRNKLK